MFRDAGLGVLFGAVVVTAAGLYFFFGGRDDSDLVALESFNATPLPTVPVPKRTAVEKTSPVMAADASRRAPASVEHAADASPKESAVDNSAQAALVIPPPIPMTDAAPSASSQSTAPPSAADGAIQLPAVHVVDTGESLSQIAERYYHDAHQTDWILKANPELKDAHSVRVGRKLIIPRPPAAVVTAPPKPVDSTDGAPPASASSSRPATYKVKSGDSLTVIAGRMLGDRRRWQEIYDLNKAIIGKHPEDLRVGTVLKLPAGSPASRPAKAATHHPKKAKR